MPLLARARQGRWLLALKAAVMVVLAYAVKQEWQQHITSATEIAASQAEKTAAEAEIQKIDAKIKKATGDTPMPEITTPAKGFRKPTTAGKWDSGHDGYVSARAIASNDRIPSPI